MKIRWKTMIVMALGVALAIPAFGAEDAGTNPLSPAASSTTGWSAGNRPNVIVIISDDQGWADIGYNNPLSVYTPNLDSLAAGGARFSNHYVMSQCSPTRVALMTGQYPSRHGIQAQQANNEQCFAHGALTISSLLKEIGYETYMAGKWHLGSHPEWGPLHHGFDHAYGSFAGAVGMYNHRYHVADDEWAITWHRDHEIIPGYENGTHATDLVAREAVRVIQQKHDKPFFLYLPFHAPHTPLDERGPFVDTPTQLDPADSTRWLNEDNIPWFNDPQGKIQSEPDPEKRLLLAAVHHLDHAIGQVVQALEETGQRENTIIFFSSDNGPQVNWAGNAYPDDLKLTDFNQPDTLRGYKGDTYEGGILVPGLINWPSQIVPCVVDEPVHIVDWMPTLAAMVDYTPAEDPKWDGMDISPLIHQADSLGSRPLYWLWRNALPTNDCRWAMRQGDWKIVRYGNEPTHASDWALYNLATDPQETTDVASSNSAKVAELHALFLIERAYDIPNRMISPRLVVPETASGPFGATLDFSESVTGLDLGDLVVSNGTVSGLSGSGTLYSFTVTPTLSSNGVVSVYLPAGGATALSGLTNVPSHVAVVKFDSSMPGAFGPLGRGVGGIETAAGDGFIMYSKESIHTRFSASPPNRYQADHFVAVRNNGGTWEYDNNSSYVAFTPVTSDLLVAAVDFSADTVTMLSGVSNVVNGIAYGYQSGDLIVIPGMWNGGPNSGEYDLGGSYIVLHGGAVIGEMPSDPSACLFAPWATSAESFTVGIEFSEDVTGLTLGDFSVSNSSLAVLSGTNRSYELEITPASYGVVRVDLHTNAVNEGTVPVVGTITHWNDYYVWANALQAEPSNPLIRDPNGDWDMDGQNNICEYYYGGDPTVANAPLVATLIVQNPVGPIVDVAFPIRDSAASRVGLQYSDDLDRWFAPGQDLSGVSNPPPAIVSAAKGTLNIVTDAVWGDVSMYSYTVAPAAGEISEARALFFRVGGIP